MENKEKPQLPEENQSLIRRIARNVLYTVIILLCFYIIILLYINLLIKEEDKSFKHITRQIRRFLGTVATQVSFLAVSILFGLLTSIPLVYFAQSGGKVFASIFTLIIALVLLFFYIRGIVLAYLQEKKLSVAFSALFPGWFKFIFWFLFTIYFLPFAIGMARINLVLGILLFLFSVILVNVLFYIDRLTNFYSKKRRTVQGE